MELASIHIIPNSGAHETHLKAIRDVNFEANCHMVCTSLSVGDRLLKTLSPSKVFICIYTHTYTHTYIYKYICMHLCVHVHVCISIINK